MITHQNITQRSGFKITYYDIKPETREQGTVLLVHGFASNANINWFQTGWVSKLHEEGYRILAFDHRGHGKSEVSYQEGDYTPDLMAKDAIAVLDEAGVKTVYLIGYSMGSRVSATLAAHFPDRIKCVVLAGLGEVLIKGQSNHLTLAQGLEAEDEDSIADPSAKMFRRFARLTGSDLKALAVCMRAPRHTLTLETLASIACPIMIVVGDQDEVAGPIAPLHQAIPQAKLTILAGKDHMSSVGAAQFRQAAVTFFETS